MRQNCSVVFNLRTLSGCTRQFCKGVFLCTYFEILHCFESQTEQAGLAQSVERMTVEREVAGSIPGSGPLLRVLK